MAVPEGSCTGTGQSSVAGSNERDGRGRLAGVCRVCGGRFRLGVDGLVPNHAPAARHGNQRR